MGPFTMGQVAFPQDMSVVTTAAERAVADLIKRGVLERDVSYEVEKDPAPMYGWLGNASGRLRWLSGENYKGVLVKTSIYDQGVKP